MANNYLEFSEVIENLTPEEIQWWKREQELICDCYDFEVQEREKSVWFHADEFGDPDNISEIVRRFLKKFRPHEYFSLTWAMYCSKPRIGKFGGGAIFATANSIEVQSSYSWLKEIKKNFERNQKS